MLRKPEKPYREDQTVLGKPQTKLYKQTLIQPYAKPR